MRRHYDFDYSHAKPNRFIMPDYYRAERRRRLQMQYQGFRTYNPLYLILLTTLALPVYPVLGGLSGFLTGLRDWTKDVRELGQFLRDWWAER